MEWKLIRNDPKQAQEFFNRKMNFTMGPMEARYYQEQGEKINIIDVRSKQDFAEAHVPGAINLPEKEWETMRGLKKGEPNIIYCYSVVCHLATKACAFFASQGFSVMEMDGGWEYWQHHRLKEETGESRVA